MPLTLATSICKTLNCAGYTAYFAGGWVRDWLLGHATNEVDIATNAPPHIIQGLFSKTIPVGIAFGVVIVVLEGINFEVTTFRKDLPYQDGRHPEGIDFSTPELDAQRRDFTINGMFYDPLTQNLYDFVEGQKDLHLGLIRAIGDPHARFAEDRLRMIRAVRFAARFSFDIEKKTKEALFSSASSLFPSVSIERVWQELCKMAKGPHFDSAVLMLHEFGLLSVMFPHLKNAAKKDLQKKVSPFSNFPAETPPIVYLLELFPDLNLEKKLEICLYLKTSKEERKITEFFWASQMLFSQNTAQPVDWARFYSHPLSDLFIRVQAAKIDTNERVLFFEAHKARQQRLSQHIERIKNHTPLVSANHLKKLNVVPGQKMGLLLKIAERLAVNEDLNDPDDVLQRLQDMM